MGWSGSDILYIINDEMLYPQGKPGDRRASGAYTGYMSGLSGFYGEDQMEMTFMEYARGIHRSAKRNC